MLETFPYWLLLASIGGLWFVAYTHSDAYRRLGPAIIAVLGLGTLLMAIWDVAIVRVAVSAQLGIYEGFGTMPNRPPIDFVERVVTSGTDAVHAWEIPLSWIMVGLFLFTYSVALLFLPMVGITADRRKS